MLIDLYKFKNNPRLEGAEVFKMLFGISDNNHIGKFPMGKDEEGCITIIRDLQINSRQWYIFTIFLDTGSVPGYDDYKLGKEYKFHEVSNNIQSLQEICCKLEEFLPLMYFVKTFIRKKRKNKKISRLHLKMIKMVNTNGEE